MGGKDKLICVCMYVNKSTIEKAIIKNNLTTIEEVGEITEAGINCGGCRDEIEEILSEING